MADGKGGLFAKRLQKQIVRAKAKVLQNLGKAEKTKDEEFEVHVNNFHKQQHDAHRLQKELKKYIDCAKEMAHASKTFYEVLNEVYEGEWVDHDVVSECGKSLELLWMDYIQKLNDQVMNPINQYINTFQDSKTKISKRGRKLVDFDNSRHNLEELMNQKKKDESKIAKANDDLNDSKRIFDELNDELHKELPNLYDKRIRIYAENFNKLYMSEAMFHTEAGKVKNQLQDIMDKLDKEYDKGTYGVKRSPSKVSTLSNKSSPSASDSPGLSKFYNVNIPSEDNQGDSDSNPPSNDEEEEDMPEPDNASGEKEETEQVNDRVRIPSASEESRYEPVEVRKDNEDTPVKNASSKPDRTSTTEEKPEADTGGADSEENGVTSVYSKAGAVDGEDKDDDDVYQVPPSNEEVTLPDGVDYAVIVGHKYDAADEDELALEPGEIVYVVPCDDPDEQDEGWLTGFKKGKTMEDRGVFPVNFTKRL